MNSWLRSRGAATKGGGFDPLGAQVSVAKSLVDLPGFTGDSRWFHANIHYI